MTHTEQKEMVMRKRIYPFWAVHSRARMWKRIYLFKAVIVAQNKYVKQVVER